MARTQNTKPTTRARAGSVVTRHRLTATRDRASLRFTIRRTDDRPWFWAETDQGKPAVLDGKVLRDDSPFSLQSFLVRLFPGRPVTFDHEAVKPIPEPGR
jgi:hypothetical protein